MSKKILLVRHAQTAANRDWLFQGQHDTSLTTLGKLQARAAGKPVREFAPEAVFCSDLGRTRDTLALFGLPKAIPVAFSPLLREKSYGEFEGKPWKSVADWADYHLDPYKKAPGGESMMDVAKRLLPLYRKIKSGPEKRVLIVTHHNPLAILLCDFLGMHYREWRHFKLSLCGLTEFQHEEGLWRVSRLNDTAHLAGINAKG